MKPKIDPTLKENCENMQTKIRSKVDSFVYSDFINIVKSNPNCRQRVQSQGNLLGRKDMNDDENVADDADDDVKSEAH